MSDTQHEAAILAGAKACAPLPWDRLSPDNQQARLESGRQFAAAYDAARSGYSRENMAELLCETWSIVGSSRLGYDYKDVPKGDREYWLKWADTVLIAARSGEAEGPQWTLLFDGERWSVHEVFRAGRLIQAGERFAITVSPSRPEFIVPEPRQDQPSLDAFDDPAELTAFRTYCQNKWGEDWETYASVEWVRLAEGWLAHSDFVAEDQPVDRASGEATIDKCLQCGLPRLPVLSGQIGGYCTCRVFMSERAAERPVEHPETGERNPGERCDVAGCPHCERPFCPHSLCDGSGVLRDSVDGTNVPLESTCPCRIPSPEPLQETEEAQ